MVASMGMALNPAINATLLPGTPRLVSGRSWIMSWARMTDVSPMRAAANGSTASRAR